MSCQEECRTFQIIFIPGIFYHLLDQESLSYPLLSYERRLLPFVSSLGFIWIFVMVAGAKTLAHLWGVFVSLILEKVTPTEMRDFTLRLRFSLESRIAAFWLGHKGPNQANKGAKTLIKVSLRFSLGFPHQGKGWLGSSIHRLCLHNQGTRPSASVSKSLIKSHVSRDASLRKFKTEAEAKVSFDP